MLREVPSGDVEQGEVLLFHAQVLEDAGRLEQCLEFLSSKSGEIVDRAMYSVQRARVLLKLERSEPALWAWELLLEENPESREYVKSTVLAKGANCGKS
jgi:peptide alpha-N-acetyltransferase